MTNVQTRDIMHSVKFLQKSRDKNVLYEQSVMLKFAVMEILGRALKWSSKFTNLPLYSPKLCIWIFTIAAALNSLATVETSEVVPTLTERCQKM